jgi:hypothetical protein
MLRRGQAATPHEQQRERHDHEADRYEGAPMEIDEVEV